MSTIDRGILFAEPAPDPKNRIEFRGTASEYFKIWIVNTCLSLVTLGIYSAWAKVRTRRYFLGNTYVHGSAFDYHGDPKKILIGRMIMAIGFFLYAYGPKISKMAVFVTLPLFWVLFPWILVRANIFNFSNTSYRNIRFGFKKDYKGCYKDLGWASVVSLVTMGFGFPFFSFSFNKFRMSRARYGSQFFDFNSKPGPFFRAYYGAVGIYFASVIVGAIVSMFTKIIGVPWVISISFVIPFAFGACFAAAFLRTQILNTVLSATKLSGVTFTSTVDVFELAIIYITNIVACIFTLGLMLPWSMIRVQKYKYSNIYVNASEETLNNFVAGASQNVSGTADAAIDFWDIDLGL